MDDSTTVLAASRIIENEGHKVDCKGGRGQRLLEA
jgi:hypothetical protein